MGPVIEMLICMVNILTETKSIYGITVRVYTHVHTHTHTHSHTAGVSADDGVEGDGGVKSDSSGEEDEVDMRAYRPAGGPILLQLLEMPPPPKMTNNWTIRRGVVICPSILCPPTSHCPSVCLLPFCHSACRCPPPPPPPPPRPFHHSLYPSVCLSIPFLPCLSKSLKA